MSTVQQRVKKSTMKKASTLLLDVNTERDKEGLEHLSMPEFLDSVIDVFKDYRNKYKRGEL